jgi:UDP-N-acetylglucosamine--N-acetylmuramyl-(pentapeptide) pyrophosphoryl-undecaprenol N-acetylglucosamine transferase
MTVAPRAHPDPRRVNVLVTSGSRGERFLGARVPELAARLRRHGLSLILRHQGGGDVAAIEQAYAGAGIEATVEPFIEDMAATLAWADFAITRAGAGTLAELALAGVPALLVPLGDAAYDHQAANAAAFAGRGAALSWREQEWNTDTVAAAVSSLLQDPSAWTSMSRAMSSLATPDAASRIVRECEALMDGRW